MRHDDGVLTVYELTNTADNGLMPSFKKDKVAEHFFLYRTVGFNRYFRASGVNMQVDALCRIWEDRSIRGNMICEINGEIYRILQVQHLFDENNMRVTDLSLERISDLDEVMSGGGII